MRITFIVARRELAGYFATPVASVFIVIFLVLQGALTFNLGNFFSRSLADLNPFFTFIPWVFLLLVPAITIGMGLIVALIIAAVMMAMISINDLAV